MPITIHSLADSMAMLREDQLPIAFDPDILMMLDTDVCENDLKCRIVNQYGCAWWLSRKPRDLILSEILDGASVGNCLDIHQRQISSSDDGSNIQSTYPLILNTMPVDNHNADWRINIY